MTDEMQPNTDNGGRWDHVANEAETMRALRDHSAEVIELPVVGTTYVVSHDYMTMVRAGAFGGDQRSVECAWVYTNPFSMMLDLAEIRTVARMPVRR